MKRFVLSITLGLSLYAQTVDEIVDTALVSNNSISSIKLLLEQKDLVIKRSENFDDPYLKVGLNDLRVDDITNRSIEPMQTNYLLVKQKIPYFGKRDIKKQIAKKQKAITFFSLQEAKSSLVENIKLEVINYTKLKELLHLNKRFQHKIKELKNLLTSYAQFNTNSHIAMIQSDLLLSSLKVKETMIKNLLANSLHTISYYANTKIKKVDFKLKDISLPDFETLETRLIKNHKRKILSHQYKLANDEVTQAKLSTKIDPVVEVGYFQRNSYEDYVSVGVGFSLPIYGTQKTKIEEQKVQRASMLAKLNDYDEALKNKLFELFENYKATKKIIKIIKKDTTFRIKNLFKLDEAKIASGDDMTSYFDTLKKFFALKEVLIDKKAQNLAIKARIDKLLGAIR